MNEQTVAETTASLVAGKCREGAPTSERRAIRLAVVVIVGPFKVVRQRDGWEGRVDKDFSKGDIFIIPLSHHIPCSVPITRLIGKVLTYYSGCRCELVHTGNASLSFDPNAAFFQGVHTQCAVQCIQRGGTPGFFVVAIRPEIGPRSLAVFTSTYDARRKGQIGSMVNPVDPANFGEVLVVWEQVIRSIHLPHAEGFEWKVLQRDEELRGLLTEAAVTTGISFAQGGDTATARVLWTRVLKEGGYNQPEVLLNIGQSYSDEGDFVEAEEWLDIAIERANSDHTLVLAHYNRGLARANRGSHERAIDDFMTCLQTAPGFSAVCNSIAACYRAMGRRNDAQAWYRRCLALPSDPTDRTREQSVVEAREGLNRL